MRQKANFPLKIIPFKNKTYFVVLMAHSNLPA